MSVSSPPTTFKVGLTPEEKRLYSQLFKSLDPDGTGIITGDKARSTFEKSGLPPTILGEIWQLADQNNLGFLTQFGFCFAMRLIGYTQAGQPPSAGLADSPGPLPKFAGSQPQPQLQPQSTNSSFMQSQPSAVVPQNTATNHSQPQDPIPSLTPNDYQKFSGLFIKTVGSSNGELSGPQARDIFLKAKLPTPTLGQIWNLVDVDNSGQLNVTSFVVAMHLIQGLLSGSIKQLPPFLPDHVWQSAQVINGNTGSGSRQSSMASVASQQTVKHTPGPMRVPSTQREVSTDQEWVVNSTLKQQYENIFNNLDKSGTGSLSSDQVASFLMTSKLGQQDLATVWDLSDIHNTGVFSKLEFSIALFLVNKKLSGGVLPDIIPQSLIESLKEPSAQPSPQVPAQKLVPQLAPQLAPSSAPQLAQPKSAMDDLVDLFGTSEASTPSSQSAPAPPPVQSRTSSSNLSNDLPRSRKHIPTAFRPTSNFGQTLMQKDTQPEETQPPVSSPEKEVDLLGEDVAKAKDQPQDQPPNYEKEVASPPPPSQQQHQQKTINYDALRSVPPPPTSRKHEPLSPSEDVTRNLSASSVTSSSQNDTRVPSQASGQQNDLLADPEISGQLSQATSDIANISNQVKSLTSQTGDLHDKKGRAERELSKILSTKKEIENKLKQLRSSYQNEVKLFDEVEANLAKAKEETEALRSESSISEAKYNHLSSVISEKQLGIDNLQKENGSIKEKLGTVNAEISEFEKQLALVDGENKKLTNQLSVKKSQAQVVIVKKEELQSQINELVANNKKLQDEIDQTDRDQQNAEKELEDLSKKLKEAKSFKPEPPKPRMSKGIAAATGAAVAGVGAAAVTGATLGNDEDSKEDIKESEPKESEPKESEPKELDNNANDDAEAKTAALVDDVKDKPSADMTGIDDIENIEDTDKERQSVDKQMMDMQINDQRIEGETAGTNATTNSSVITDDKATEGDTPVTSPGGSEVQFPQGSMVGMPGVLVGVQRTDSLTSSVQNNAALSVRDDNIEEVSDKDTIGQEEILSSSPTAEANTRGQESRSESNQESDGDKPSSGVESFELVNADDIKDPENNHFQYQGDKPKGNDSGSKSSTTFVMNRPNVSETRDMDEEFPPIRELDYDESSSDEDNTEFDDAKDVFMSNQHTGQQHESPNDQKTMVETKDENKPSDEFDNAFDDLEPAKPDEKDMFDDLEAAKIEEPGDNSEFNQEDIGLTNDFTNSNMPDFNPNQTVDTTKSGNDEWEQLFAGFGNQASTQASPNVTQEPFVPSGDQDKIQELVGMGFDEHVAMDALEKEQWNVEAATNYLLDHA